jgi:hypothetical protein
MSNRPKSDLNKAEHGTVAAFLSNLLGSLDGAGLSEKMLRELIKDRERLDRGTIAFVDAVVQFTRIINCDVNPKEHRGMAVDQHQKQGLLQWNSAKISLYLSEHQKGYKRMKVVDLYEEVKNKGILNGCVLDFLLEYDFLAPEAWKKGGYIFFWATIYKKSLSETPTIHNKFVRGVYWNSVHNRWGEVRYCFDTTMDEGCRTAILEAV